MERQREIGLELARMQDRLSTLAVEIGNAYPKNGRRSTAMHTAYVRLNRARSVLDDELFTEYPREATPDVYYPSRETRKGTDGGTA